MAADNRRSSMFVGSLVAAIATTVALAFLITLQVNSPPPRPEQQGGAVGRPPAPPILNPQNLTSLVVIAAALFTIAWIATIAAAIRDQILRETHKIMSEYGDLRETDGYVSGLHQRSRPDAEVLRLRPLPPID